MRISQAFRNMFAAEVWQDMLQRHCLEAWLDTDPTGRYARFLNQYNWVCSASSRYRVLCTYNGEIIFPESVAQNATKLYIGNGALGWCLEYSLDPPEPHFLFTGIPVYFAPRSIILALPAE